MSLFADFGRSRRWGSSLLQLAADQRTILGNAASMVGTTAVTSALGAAFWVVAAREFSPSDVGFAATATSAMTLLGTFGTVGLSSLLISELPHYFKRSGALISTALVIALTLSALVGMIFAVIAPRLSNELLPLGASVAAVALFALGVGLTAVTLILDQALIGLLKGMLQFARNTVFAFTKLVLLAAMAWWSRGDGIAIYATWIAGIAASLVVLAAWQARDVNSVRAFRPTWLMVPILRRGAPRHHALNLSLQTSSFALPLVITVVLSTETTAHFYAAWMISGMLFVGSRSLATVLFAVGTQEPHLLAQRLRFTLLIAVAVGIGSSLFLALGSEQILLVFGGDYAHEASLSLKIFGLGFFPLIVRDHYAAISRIHGHLLKAARLATAGCILELGLAATGGVVWGLSGLSFGWLVAVAVQACFMAPTVYKATRYQYTQVSQPVEYLH